MSDQAVALRYEKEYPAPLITAKGRGHLAEKMRELAKAHGVHIHRDENLAENLMLFDVDSFIPEELYGMVAHILAFVYAVEKRVL